MSKYLISTLLSIAISLNSPPSVTITENTRLDIK
jgi:hypothetical protein